MKWDGHIIKIEMDKLDYRLKHHLKQTIIRQWGLPRTDSRYYFLADYINGMWPKGGFDKNKIGQRAVVKRSLEKISQILELEDLVKPASDVFYKDNRLAYQLCYGIGALRFYSLNGGMMTAMSNDLNVFHEFEYVDIPDTCYSAKIILSGFDEKSAEFETIKKNLYYGLKREDNQVIFG